MRFHVNLLADMRSHSPPTDKRNSDTFPFCYTNLNIESAMPVISAVCYDY